MSKSEKLGKLASDAAVIVPVAGVYMVGSNELLRRTSIPLWGKGLLTTAVGVGSGLAAGSYVPRIGVGLIVGGALGGLINGVNAINMARYRGKLNAPRAALPGSSTSTTTTTSTTSNGHATTGLPPARREAPAMSAVPAAAGATVRSVRR